MISGILLVLLIVFGCLGICDFIHALKSLFFNPHVKTDTYCLVFLKPGSAQNQLRYFSWKLRWYGSEFCNKLIGFVDELSDVEASACENYCYGGNIYLCRTENVAEQIKFLETGEADG